MEFLRTSQRIFNRTELYFCLTLIVTERQVAKSLQTHKTKKKKKKQRQQKKRTVFDIVVPPMRPIRVWYACVCIMNGYIINSIYTFLNTLEQIAIMAFSFFFVCSFVFVLCFMMCVHLCTCIDSFKIANAMTEYSQSQCVWLSIATQTCAKTKSTWKWRRRRRQR